MKMSIPQYTTPTFVLTFTEQDLDLTNAFNVYVTFRSGTFELTKTGSDLTVNKKSIGVYLSQNDTSGFRVGTLEIQANWTTEAGGRSASEIVKFEVTEQLLRKVVE